VAANEVTVSIGDGIEATAFLRLPATATGLVLFAHGSGSSRHSPRNGYVADALAEGNIASLLLDPLTPQEEALDLRTAQMTAPCELTIVPGATHLFEEPGALAEVARLARAWFRRYLE